MTHDRLDIRKQLDALLEPYNKADAPGLVVGVALRGNALYRRGFGLASIEHGTINTPATRMRIGSTSKHFTCLAALLLAEEGKLDVDAGIRTYIPELPVLAGDPTLRQLMTHTGGYRCYLDLWVLTQGVVTMPRGASLAAEIRQRDVNFRPGERMIYCNGGYHLLSLAIERVSGMPFETFLSERIFRVMGMVDTEAVADDMQIRPRMATQHVPDGKGGYIRGLFPSWEVRGEGGIVSTIDDMLRWTAHLRMPDKLGTQEAWRQMLTKPHYSSGAEGVYALGLMRTPHRNVELLHHAGGVFGGSCQMLTVVAHGLDVVVLTNGAPVDPVALATQIVDVVLGDEVLGAPQAAPLATNGHESLLGRYFSRADRTYCEIVDRDGHLAAVIHNQKHQALPLIETPEGLRVEDGSGGTLMIRPGTTSAGRMTTIEFIDCGHASLLDRLPDEAPPISDAFAGMEGAYFSGDAAAHAGLTLSNGAVSMRLEGTMGGVNYQLVPVSEDVFLFEPADAQGFSTGVLTVDRANGRVSRFWLDTSRTRGLAFSREI